MNYNHLSIEERCCIRKYYVDGKSYREIARLIGRDVSTISREIRRNCTHYNYVKPTYYPHAANRKAQRRKSFCHRGIFWGEDTIRYIEGKLLETWSPEQIANTACDISLPSFKTIYRWLYEGYLLKGNVKVLRKKGKTRKRQGNSGRYVGVKSIRKRAKSVYKREEVGHWEMDTVVGGQGKSKACFATFVERKTRYYIAVWMPNRTAKTMEDTVVKTLGSFPKEMVKTIVCDRGSEFANWREIEDRLGCEVYFADAYCAWQKGTNENSNGLLREFYPKGHSLARVGEKRLLRNLALINARPRKVLHYKSPVDLFTLELHKVLHLI